MKITSNSTHNSKEKNKTLNEKKTFFPVENEEFVEFQYFVVNIFSKANISLFFGFKGAPCLKI